MDPICQPNAAGPSLHLSHSLWSLLLSPAFCCCLALLYAFPCSPIGEVLTAVFRFWDLASWKFTTLFILEKSFGVRFEPSTLDTIGAWRLTHLANPAPQFVHFSLLHFLPRCFRFIKSLPVLFCLSLSFSSFLRCYHISQVEQDNLPSLIYLFFFFCAIYCQKIFLQNAAKKR